MATLIEDSAATEAVETEKLTEEIQVVKDDLGNPTGNPNLSDRSNRECLDDPNFATICSFLEKFGELVRLGEMPFDELQMMLENTTEVPDALVKLHVSLLRRVFKSITPDKWEKHLAKFGHTYCNQDGWEIERFGYKKAKLQTKLRILKNLMEAQFDCNVKFKAEVNKLQAEDLRLIPLGRDCEGQVYWYQVDNDANLRVYREDIDDETWETVAATREEFCELITKLQKGDVKKPLEAIIVDEDSNEKEIETKEIILDTGKVEESDDDEESDESEEEEDEDSEEDEESLGIIVPSKTKDKKVTPKLSTVPKTIPPEPLKKAIPIPKEAVSDMDVDDHSDEMEIDESPPKILEPVPVKMEQSDQLKHNSEAVNLRLQKSNIHLKSKHDEVKEEDKLTNESLKVPVREEAVVKDEVKVLKSEQEPYQKNESVKTIDSKPPLVSVSEPLKLKTEDVDKPDKKVDSVSIRDEIKSKEIIQENNPGLVIKSSKTPEISKDDSSQSIDEKNIKKIDVEEVITKTDAWICGKDVSNKIIDETIFKPKTLVLGKDYDPKCKSSTTLTMQKEGEPVELISKAQIQDSNKTPIVSIPEELKDNITGPDSVIKESDVSHLETQILEVESGSQESALFSKTETDVRKNEALTKIIPKSTDVSNESEILAVPGPGSEGLQKPSILHSSPIAVAEPVLLEPMNISDNSGELQAKQEVKDEPKAQTNEELRSKISSSATSIGNTKAEKLQDPNLDTIKGPKIGSINDGVAQVIQEVTMSELEPIEMPKAVESIPVPNITPETVEISKIETMETPKEELIKEQEPKAETIKNSKVEAIQEQKTEFVRGSKSQAIEPEEQKSPDPKPEEIREVKAENVVIQSAVQDIEMNNSIPLLKDKKQESEKPIAPVEPEAVLEKSADPVTQDDHTLSMIVISDPMKSIGITDPTVSVKSDKETVELKVTSHNLNEFPLPKPVDQSSSVSELNLADDKNQLTESMNIECEKNNIDSKTNEAITQLPILPNEIESQRNAPKDSLSIKNIGTGATSKPEVHPERKSVAAQEELLPKASLLGLVSYDSSDDSEVENMEECVKSSKKEVRVENIQPSETSKDKAPLPDSGISDNGIKRKAEGSVVTPSKLPKLSDTKASVEVFNPIVGEAVEEEMIIITGEGSGAQNEGGNDELDLDSNHKENISNGNNASKKVDCEKSASNAGEGTEAVSENEDSQESLEIKRPQKRGRPSLKKKPGPKSASGGERKPRSAPGRPRGRSEVAKLGVPLDSLEVNGSGDNERPVRASRRIAQIRQKEEEERRQLEEERLAQLKAAQLRKKQKQAEAAKLRVGEEDKIGKSKGIKGSKLKHVDYMPSPSASDSNSAEDEGEDYENEEVAKPKGKRRKKRSKNGRHKAGNPWATSSDEEDSEAVEEEEEYHYEEEEQLVFNESDHEFSPESDLGEDGDAGPSRHARTAKRGEIDKEEETGCRKCGKGDHPEWILLCDKCDHGWHASCLRPQLWVIPEGQWFCPPCQHNLLVSKMNENLIEFDKLFKRRENDILRKQRLAFVGISLNNVLPTPEKEENIEERKSSDERGRRDKKSRRRIILSDEEISDNFIDDDGSNGRESDRSSDEDSGGPIYRLRTRRGAKTFDYKAYDEMINSAIRASDEEIEEIAEVVEAEAVDTNATEVNGDEETVPAEVEHSGKNEAFEKHLQDEEDETDEELLGEKERLKRRENKKAAQKKKRRSLRDLDDYTDEDNSDEDFKGSDGQEDDENDEDAAEDDESEWSGDKDDSDDSIAARSRNRGKKGKYGRREQYLEVGTVRRSTRRRKARVSYDESDQDEEEEGEDKWNSEESDAEDSPSESDDETYGKRKKQKKVPARSAVPRFFLGAIGSKSPAKKPSSGKKKRRKVDEDDVDRAWSSSQGSKAKKKAAEETVERRTRGRKINFKDILDSGESDDDGNIRPKRRRISSDDDEEASTSRRLAEEIKAANQREAAMYAAQQKKGTSGGKVSDSVPTSAPSSIEDENESKDSEDQKSAITKLSQIPPVTTTTSVLTKPVVMEASKNSDKPTTLELEMALAKPVPAPPIPPALAKALGRTSNSNKSRTPAGSGDKSPLKSQTNHGTPHIPVASAPIIFGSVSASSGIPSTTGGPPISGVTSISTMPSISGHPILATMSLAATGVPPISAAPNTSSSTKSKEKKGLTTPDVSVGSPPIKPSSTPPMTLASPMRPIMSPLQQQTHGLLPPGLPMDMGRVSNPTLFQGNPAMRPYHPMWVRNPGPPPYGAGGVPPPSIGKPPPLNSTAFMGQHGPPRPGYPSPPPLRIPNPNTSPLQAFQHFKNDSPHGPGAMYRMPPGGPPGGLPGLLVRGMVPHQGPPERFFGGPSPFSPYNILPPHTQSQPPQSMFSASQYDFRPGEPFKDERRGTPPGPSSPPTSQPAPSTVAAKEEPSQQESEFGGLVSYFSSQRSEEDMDT